MTRHTANQYLIGDEDVESVSDTVSMNSRAEFGGGHYRVRKH